MTEEQQALREALNLLCKQFMERKSYNPIDIIVGALGSGDVFYRKVARRIYKEANDLFHTHTLDRIVFSKIPLPEFKSEDTFDLYVTSLYVTPHGEIYFGMESRDPKLVEMLPHLKFSFDYMPFMTKLVLGIKLEK